MGYTSFYKFDVNRLFNHRGPFVEDSICLRSIRIAQKYSFVTSRVKFSKMNLPIYQNIAPTPKGTKISYIWFPSLKKLIRGLLKCAPYQCFVCLLHNKL